MIVQSGITINSAPGLGGMSVRQVDLGTNGSTIKNFDLQGTPITITATSVPGSPQWTYTVLGADIPTNADVSNWQAVVTFGGQNTDGLGAHDINWRIGLDGVYVAGDGQVAAIDPTTPYWFACAVVGAGTLTAGNVIDLKLWADAASDITLEYLSVYFIPCQIIASQSQMLSTPASLSPQSWQRGTTGTITGVTFIAGANVSSVWNSQLIAGVNGNFTSGNVWGYPFYFQQGTGDTVQLDGNQDTAKKLYKTDNILLRYFYIYS